MEKIKFDADTTKSCQNCKYCDTVVNAAQATSQMFCRRNAPRGMAQCIGLDAAKQPSWVFATVWPAVATTDWCGEFVRKVQA